VLAAPAAWAQEGNSHIEAGVFADYFRQSQTDTNFGGIGARLGVGVFSHVKLEAEMAYAFDQTFGENLTNGGRVIVVQD